MLQRPLQRRTGLESLPDPDLYRQYLADHKDRLVAQLLDDHQFLHDAAALKTIPEALKKVSKKKKGQEAS